MRPCFPVGILALAAAFPACAQSTCLADRLPSAATRANALRHTLQTAAVREGSEAIPASIDTQLIQFKEALSATAEAAFVCAPASAAAEQLQTTLAAALHANSTTITDTTVDPRTHLEKGAYGSNLAVQVFELFGAPRILEVDFRYGIECGDDHLLLTFETASDVSTAGWHEQLRYGTASYRTVGDALGDFVLLTPLTGDDTHRSWHYLLAHGHPSCKETPRPSIFDLDLFTPASDPAKPTKDWHFQHAYTAGVSTPRLATTEDTIEFRLAPAPPPEPDGKPAPTQATPPEVFRFRYTATGHVEPLPSQVTESPTSAGTGSSSTRH